MMSSKDYMLVLTAIGILGYSLWNLCMPRDTPINSAKTSWMEGKNNQFTAESRVRDIVNHPAVAVIAYTGQSNTSGDFPPTFITSAANDGIANIQTVEKRVADLRRAGVEVEYRRYEKAGHGFGLGTGTDAEGWSDLAADFWQRHITR